MRRYALRHMLANTRSECLDECLEGVRRLMNSSFNGPVNIGSEEMISINNLALMVMEIAGKKLKIKNIDGPTGVRGRRSRHTRTDNDHAPAHASSPSRGPSSERSEASASASCSACMGLAATARVLA